MPLPSAATNASGSVTVSWPLKSTVVNCSLRSARSSCCSYASTTSESASTLSFDQALALQSEAANLLAVSEFAVESQAVLQLVRDSDCSACDCEFIVLATQLDANLLTMDKKLLRAFRKRAVALIG